MRKALRILAGLICLGMLGVRGEENDSFRTEFAGRRNRLFRNGKAVTFADCLREQSRRYPEMEARDAVKLAYQAAYGAAHGVKDPAAAWNRFTAEYAAAAPEPGPLCEVISPDVCRIDLRAWKAAGLPEQWLFNLFCAPGEPFTDGDEVFADRCRQAEEVLPQLREPLRTFLKHYRGGPVRHSETYREKYRPSYRLVSTRYLPLLPVLVKAASLP